jgi:thiaminase
MEIDELEARYGRLFATFKCQRFFLAVADGTITSRQIGTYLVQDAHYLRALGDRLRDLAQLVEEPTARSILQEHARDTENPPDVAVQIVARDLGLLDVARQHVRPPTGAYIDHQRRSVGHGVREGILSVLPCYLFYPYFVTAIRAKAHDSELLQKCLPFISTLEEAHRWTEEIFEVWNRVGLAEPLGESEVAFVLSAQYEADLLGMAMK